MHASTCTSALVTLPSLHSSASFLIPHHVCAPPSLPRFLHLLLPSSLCPDLPSLVPAGRLHGSGSGGGHGLVAYTGVAVVGDMECTGSSCSPPNPPTAKYPALPLFFQPSHSVAFRVLPSVPPKRPEPPFKLEPLVAVVGAEGGSTPLGWDGMGENRDWVVWNKYIEGCSRGQQDGEQEGSTRGSRRAAEGAAGGQQKGHQQSFDFPFQKLSALISRWRGGACGSTPTLPHAPPLWPTGGRQHCSTAPVSLLGATRGEYGDGLGLTRLKVGSTGVRVESTLSLTSSSLLFPFPPSSTLPGLQRSLSLP
ncbi:unnamed protein product [Closterium sp. NIES-64]|nr:unnamed protein product [Closterium sp. NIES-64]CAI6006361.1 unnamed protein product [Closterium sp. NIES-64]